MALIPVIDEASCIGQGDCMELAPAVFLVDDCAHVIGTGPDELLLAAAHECPVEAISLVDSDTGEQVYP
ncbi:MAG: ferredoxin [Solirubrobacteraceae bacterium]